MNERISLVHRIVCVEALCSLNYSCAHIHIYTHAWAYFVTLGMQTSESLNSLTSVKQLMRIGTLKRSWIFVLLCFGKCQRD